MTLHLNKRFATALLAFSIFAGPQAFAYKVKDISGKKVLIDLEGEKLFVNDIVISINKTSDGPEIAGSAKVLQIRDKLAVAIISDGKFIIGKKVARKAGDITATAKAGSKPGSASAVGNPSLDPSAPKKSSKVDPEYAEDEEIYETAEQRRYRLKNASDDGIVFRKDMLKVSLLGAFSSDKISAKQADDTLPFAVTETVPMSGSNSGVGLAFDYPSRWGVTLRTVVLNEKLFVSGISANPNMCAGRTSTNCMADINYISVGEHLRFDLNLSRFTFWAAGGLVFKFPTSRNTSSLRQEDISVANAVVGSVGMDFAFNNRFFMPFAFEYHYSLNKSDSVPIIDHSAFMVGFGAKF